jgi:hypothetical protein
MAALLVLSAVLVALPLVSSATANPQSAPKSGLEILGRLPEPTVDGIAARYIVQVDVERRLLYYLWRRGTDFYLREYDIRPDVPKLARETFVGTYSELEINSASPYTMQLDSVNRRLLLLGQASLGSAIKVVDLKTFKVTSTWDLGQVVPGFVAQGMTYVAKDARVYVLGSQSGNAYGAVNTIANKPAQVAQVVAIDVSDPKAGAKLAWVRPIPQCQQVMDTFTVGALIARSLHEPALYFACVRADPWPGESGVVRLRIDPKAGPQDATAFPVEFFPVSGSYTSATQGIVGVAAFNYKTDRFYMQSLALATPGAWVFDGRLSAWAGFIAAPDSSNQYLGLDQASGHFFMAGQEEGNLVTNKGGFMLVTNGTQTPVPQGDVTSGLGATGFIVTDPVTHRLFVPMGVTKLGLAIKDEDAKHVGIVVLKDNTPTTQPPKPEDYDALTSDIPEGPQTVTNFSGDVNGFGERAVLVGGYGGVLSASGQPITLPPPAPQLRPGDRGITAARVSSVDLRNAGASAAAQSLLVDTNTEAELIESGAPTWPWAPAACLDGGNAPLDSESKGPQGTADSATVACDLAKQRAEGVSSYKALTVGPVSVGSSSFHGAAWRDAKEGVVTQTVSQASGIELAAPDGQTVSIAQVAAVARTVAHGRPGTAKATWRRTLSGVSVTGADGEVTELGSCSTSEETDACKDLVAQLNDVLQTKMRVTLPRPIIRSTPKGAFAGIEQTDADFFQGRTVDNQGTTFSGEAASRAVPSLQITVYNDTVEKSRLLVQLAALQANSIYTNSPYSDQIAPPPPAPENQDGNTSAPSSTLGGGSSGGSVSSDMGAGGLGDTGGNGLSSGSESGTALAAPVAAELGPGVLAFLTRSPKEALLFAGVWLLFGGAVMAIVRRRSLLGVLTGKG